MYGLNEYQLTWKLPSINNANPHVSARLNSFTVGTRISSEHQPPFVKRDQLRTRNQLFLDDEQIRGFTRAPRMHSSRSFRLHGKRNDVLNMHVWSCESIYTAMAWFDSSRKKPGSCVPSQADVISMTETD